MKMLKMSSSVSEREVIIGDTKVNNCKGKVNMGDIKGWFFDNCKKYDSGLNNFHFKL